jgi:hypothetical protein
MGAPPKPPERPNVVTIDAVMQLMRDDRMRGFRIDIETDSTIQADENEYKQRLGEMVTGVGMFIEKVMPAAEAHPELAPFLGEMLLTVTRGYRVGRQMEGALEDAVVAIEDKAAQGQGGRIDPATAKAQADAAMKKMEIEAQLKERGMIEEAENARSKERIAADMQKHREALAAANDPQAKQLEIQKMQAELHFKKEELGLKKQGQEMDLELKARQHALQEQQAQKEMAMKEADLVFRSHDQGLKHQAQEHTHGMDRERFEHEKQAGAQEMDFKRESGAQEMQFKRDSLSPEEHVGPIREGMQGFQQSLESVTAQLGAVAQALMQQTSMLAQQVQALADEAAAPAEFVRGPDGKAIGIKKGSKTRNIRRGPDGKPQGFE